MEVFSNYKYHKREVKSKYYNLAKVVCPKNSKHVYSDETMKIITLYQKVLKHP